MELDRPIWKRSRNTDTLKGARICGSSKQGKALRAPFGRNTVAANNLQQKQNIIYNKQQQQQQELNRIYIYLSMPFELSY